MSSSLYDNDSRRAGGGVGTDDIDSRLADALLLSDNGCVCG